jgi:hypothetical protein
MAAGAEESERDGRGLETTKGSYHVAEDEMSSSGTRTLAETETAIQDHEGGYARFLSNRLSADGGVKKNMVKFEQLELGSPRPNPFKLALSTAAVPDGYSKIWQGAMFVSGRTENVTAWRKDTA